MIKKIIKKCVICGSDFSTYSDKSKCCSIKCGYDFNKKGENVNCPVCGKRFYLCKSKIKRGYKFCSQKCSKKGRKTRKGTFASKETRERISKNHHSVRGINNPNWKGGITPENIKYKNKTWKQYKKWRDSVLERDGNRCKDCGSNINLHAHHIIARKTLIDAEFFRANGVTLCKKCHKKTDSWGGGVDSIKYNRSGRLIKFVMKVIPHHWQDYPTVGNYFYTKGGAMVIFCSDMGNDKYHTLVFAHEMFESSLVLARKIKISDIDKFDIKYEEERGRGLHRSEDEPGDDKRAPYRKEHIFATKMEKLLAIELNVKWNEYNDAVNSL